MNAQLIYMGLSCTTLGFVVGAYLMAKVTANSLTETAFWSNLFANLRKQNPKEYRDRVAEAMDEGLDIFKGE